MNAERSATASLPSGATAPPAPDSGASLLASAIELQTLARDRDPLGAAAPAGPEPLTRMLAFGFAFSTLLAVALIVELLAT